MKVLTLLVVLINLFQFPLIGSNNDIRLSSSDSSVKDVIITKDGKQLLGKLRAAPSLKFSFGSIDFNGKEISLIIYHQDKNKLQYITKNGHSYSAEPFNDHFIIDSIENDKKLDASKILAIFTSNEYLISKKNEANFYLITLKNEDQFTTYLSENDFKNSFKLSHEIPIQIPNKIEKILLSTNDILSIRRIDSFLNKEIANTLEEVLKNHHIIEEKFLTKSVGISWDEIKKEELALNISEQKNRFEDRFSFAEPGLKSNKIKSLDQTIAYEDFNQFDMDQESIDFDEEEDEVDTEYTFITSHEEEKLDSLISLNEKDEKKGNKKIDPLKKIISVEEYANYLKLTSQKEIPYEGDHQDPIKGITVQQAKKFADWKNKILVIRGKKLQNAELGMLVETPSAVEWISDDYKKLPSKKKVEKKNDFEKRL